MLGARVHIDAVGNDRLDVSLPQFMPERTRVVPFVRHQTLRAFSRTTVRLRYADLIDYRQRGL